MNTIKVPEPIMREEYTRNGDRSHVTLGARARGDHFNLSTGEVTVARVIGGVRYDTVTHRCHILVTGNDSYRYRHHQDIKKGETPNSRTRKTS